MNSAERLILREETFLRYSYKANQRRTGRILTQERKDQMIQENMHKFGKISIGVHGKELPKFTEKSPMGDDKREWWMFQRGFVKSPT